MNNRYSNFMQINRALWAQVTMNKGTNGLLLVESTSHPVISHGNAVFARVIKEAKGLSIGWINPGRREIRERLASYDATSRIVTLSKLSFLDKVNISLRFAYFALWILVTKDILKFSLDGVRFGDILYDSYLSMYHVATIRKVNKGLLSSLFRLIYNYYQFKKTLQDCGASAVLVSHQVGINSGVLMRTALRLGLCVYLRGAGTRTIRLNLVKSLSDIYQNASKPRAKDMQLFRFYEQARLNNEFEELMEKRTDPHHDKDASHAYDEKKKTYHSKSEFANKFALSATKKFVFVMLHAFNDQPHSHFGQMLFKDYYDWFVQTLEFAKTKPDVNWIFKQHPTTALYPTYDISLPDHFSKCPEHIVFLDAKSSFNSKSLLYIADLVVTVCGTAGIEFVAAGGIPAITAGTTEYTGFGITIEPCTKAEYFQILSNIATINKPTKNQQNTARKVFLYIQRYSYLPYSFSPFCSIEEIYDPALDSYYWERLTNLYEKNCDRLLADFKKYVMYVRKKEFSRLSQL